jgi:hypothetical protein
MLKHFNMEEGTGMGDWTDSAELEKKLKELGGPGGGANVESPAGRKAQTVFAMLHANRLREQVEVSQRQVEVSQKLARYTFWMAGFVAVASLAQVVTVWLAFSAR